MFITAIILLVVGILAGAFLLPPNITDSLSALSEPALFLLIFCVGLGMGLNTGLMQKLKAHSWTVLLIPLGGILGSIAGGLIVGLIIGMPPHQSGAIAAGLGWYSLSSVILSNLAGASIGVIAFFSNISREIFAFLFIGVTAKYLGHYAAIAPGGATSMDTTLPVVARYTSADIAVLSVMNGVIMSFVVPVLVPFIYNFFQF